MARSGWSGSNHLNRTTNLPTLNAASMVAVAYYDPSWSGDWGILGTVENGTAWCSFGHDPSGLILSSFGMTAAHTIPDASLSAGWYAIAGSWDTTSAILLARRLGTTTVLVGTGGSGNPSSSAGAQFAIGSNGNYGENWEGAIARLSMWSVAKTQAQLERELFALAPADRTNLLVDWRGMHDTLDLSGNGALTLTGSLTAVDGGPLTMGDRVITHAGQTTKAFDSGVGFNFRQTVGYVTDGAREKAVLYMDTYPLEHKLAEGIAYYGYTTGIDQIGARDRTTGNDRRLAGLHFQEAGTGATFVVDLPSPGMYDVSLAIGDPSYDTYMRCVVYDGTRPLFKLPWQQITANNFADAHGNIHSAANWPTRQRPRRVFCSSGQLRVKVSVAATQTGSLAHLSLTRVTEQVPLPTQAVIIPPVNRFPYDEFTVDLNPLGGYWVTIPGQSPLRSAGGVVRGTSANADHAAYFSGYRGGMDQWSEVTIDIGEGGTDAAAIVRAGPNYNYFYSANPSGIYLVSNGAWGSALTDFSGTTWVAGDRLRLEARGINPTRLTAYKNDVPLPQSVVENSLAYLQDPATNGYPGVFCYSDNANFALSAWRGGSLDTVLGGRTGWSAGDYLKRTTNLPSNNLAMTAKAIVYYDPAFALTGKTILDCTDSGGAGAFTLAVRQNVGFRLYVRNGTEATYDPGSAGWYVIAAKSDATYTNCVLMVRKLGTTAINEAVMSSSVASLGIVNMFLGTDIGGTETYPGPMYAIAVWNAAHSTTELARELWSLAPVKRSNLLLDWRGEDAVDRSGTQRLTMVGQPAWAEPAPLGMGGVAVLTHPVVSAASPATWAAAEDANINAALTEVRRLRMQLQGSGVVRPKLQVRKVGDSVWKDVT